MRCTTGCQHEAIHLRKVLFVICEASKADHSFVGHQAGAIIKCFVDAVWLVKHLHNIIMVNAGRLVNLDAFLRHSLNLVVLDFVIESQLHDLAVIDVVVAFSVVLENCRVTRYNLEFVRILAFFCCSSRILRLFNLFYRIICFSAEPIRKANDHRSAVFEYVHVIWLKDRDKYERVCTFQCLRSLRYRIEKAESFIKCHTN